MVNDNRNDIIKFIQDNYSEDEILLWNIWGKTEIDIESTCIFNTILTENEYDELISRLGDISEFIRERVEEELSLLIKKRRNNG